MGGEVTAVGGNGRFARAADEGEGEIAQGGHDLGVSWLYGADAPDASTYSSAPITRRSPFVSCMGMIV